MKLLKTWGEKETSICCDYLSFALRASFKDF